MHEKYKKQQTIKKIPLNDTFTLSQLQKELFPFEMEKIYKSSSILFSLLDRFENYQASTCLRKITKSSLQQEHAFDVRCGNCNSPQKSSFCSNCYKFCYFCYLCNLPVKRKNISNFSCWFLLLKVWTWRSFSHQAIYFHTWLLSIMLMQLYFKELSCVNKQIAWVQN